MRRTVRQNAVLHPIRRWSGEPWRSGRAFAAGTANREWKPRVHAAVCAAAPGCRDSAERCWKGFTLWCLLRSSPGLPAFVGQFPAQSGRGALTMGCAAMPAPMAAIMRCPSAHPPCSRTRSLARSLARPDTQRDTGERHQLPILPCLRPVVPLTLSHPHPFHSPSLFPSHTPLTSLCTPTPSDLDPRAPLFPSTSRPSLRTIHVARHLQQSASHRVSFAANPTFSPPLVDLQWPTLSSSPSSVPSSRLPRAM